ncbi:CIA30 family protein [Rhodobacter capsulatus]|uniref:CIA30 family protein n=1 Tax=Rhodobacter capsulatus TaxID=1061 RepID=UPI0006DC93A2|nr:CIA30 family protein [Rhodobacter capsulatus]KQB14261.1 NADH ubiquinone oxidoreductase [Rhodobacter capsulatus]KQB17844.1 NADH ubiquinone oxidoreductase [Rhodobacter capsulatus]PZX27133.1 complex I intermediate-associated protein 30 (CIA30) [Rhodobacter capsulatus]QNR64232.1 CIA30 family protein [Rhodobacter capsulatus]
MRRLSSLVLSLALGLAAVLPALAADTVPGTVPGTVIEDFTMQPETRWRFFTDAVMGGVSTGRLEMVSGEGPPHARMTGHVSTENNGGFIQMRLDLAAPPPAGTTGLRLIVRGNGQRYFAHLRNGATLMPWQYYQAPFEVTPDWAEIRLPFTAFRASGRLMPGTPAVKSLRSVGVVAYGRAHDAEIEVREVGFY